MRSNVEELMKKVKSLSPEELQRFAREFNKYYESEKYGNNRKIRDAKIEGYMQEVAEYEKRTGIETEVETNKN